MKHQMDQGTVEPGLRRRSVLSAAALLGLGACMGPKKVEPDDYQPVAMPGEPIKDAAGDGTRRTRVVVLPSDEPAGVPAGARLAARATSAVEQVLSSGGVEIIDRSLADRLGKELQLSEMKGAGSYGGPDIADFVVRVKMASARAESSYVQPSSYTDKKTGKTTTIPGGWSNAGKAAGTIEIRSLPALKLVNTIQIDGSVSESQQPGQGNQLGLMQSATDKGVGGKRADLLNYFSPKGYIVERRTRKDESIFRVRLGRNSNAKPGQAVEIYRLDSYGDEKLVGEAEMSAQVGMEGSWIVVKDQGLAGKVRHGDYVKVKHGGFMDTIRNLGNAL